MPCHTHYHPRKNTSILALREVGLSNMPVPLPSGLPPIPKGLPPTPDANFLPARLDELLGRCCKGVENVPNDEDVVAPKALCDGEGVPMDTERGESIRDGVRRGEGRVPDGDAL